MNLGKKLVDSIIEDLVVVALVLLKVFVVFAGMMLLLALPLLVCIIACKVAGLRRMPPVHAAGARSWIYCHFPFLCSLDRIMCCFDSLRTLLMIRLPNSDDAFHGAWCGFDGNLICDM